MKEEKYIVRSNLKGVIRLVENKLFIQPNIDYDLVKLLRKSVAELKQDKEIRRELMYNNLLLVSVVEEAGGELEKKVDAILDLLTKNIAPAEQPAQPAIDMSELTNLLKAIGKRENLVLENEAIPSNGGKTEEQMRMEAMQDYLKRNNKLEKNISKLGKDKEVGEMDDFSNLIDF